MLPQIKVSSKVENQDESILNSLTHKAWKFREQNFEYSSSLIQKVTLQTNNLLLNSQAQIVQAYVIWRNGKLEEALKLIQPALDVVREHHLSDWLARALNVRNCIRLELGDFEQGIRGLEEQLKISQDNQDIEMEACAMHDLGVMHFERNPLIAEPFLQRALELFKLAEEPGGHASSLLNLAHVHQEKGDISEANLLLTKVLSLARVYKLDYIETYALAQQGVLELADNNVNSALELLSSALERMKNLGGRPLAEVMPSLVECFRRQGNLAKARDLLENHLKSLQASGFLPHQVQAHEMLVDVNEELGDIHNAFLHSRDYMRLFQTVYLQEHEDKVRALEVLHRTQLAEQRAATEVKKNTELRSSLNKLTRLKEHVLEVSLTDELTGLRNRRYLLNNVAQTLQKTSFTLAILDLDHFKRINDNFGHDNGDLVLKTFAGLLQTHVREGDIAIRLGGEEFIVIFPNTNIPKAKGVLTRLLSIMRNSLWLPQKPEEYLTFTAGLTKCSNNDLQASLKVADDLLYEGKKNGRNCVWTK